MTRFRSLLSCSYLSNFFPLQGFESRLHQISGLMCMKAVDKQMDII
jgi:hypothetical protein